MTTYCPHCWAEVDAAAQVCPGCRARLANPGSYVTKLIAALRHPEPLTQRRAAYVLGLLRDPSAVEAIAAVLAGSADPYVKGEAAHALGAIGGAGLGLAIVKQLVTAHGGGVAVESVAGQGSTFTFTLRVAATDLAQSYGGTSRLPAAGTG